MFNKTISGTVLLSIWLQLIDLVYAKEQLQLNNGSDLTVCCDDESFYRQWLDICRPGIDDETVPSLEIPWVHSATNLTRDLIVCPEGYISSSSTEFHLFYNGALQVNVSDVELTLQPGEFCLNEILTEEFPSIGSHWAARFCIQDESYCGPETNCIRKCCPIGMAFNKTGRFCQQYDYANITEYLPEPFDLRGGLAPKCPDDGRAILDEENFHILADGKLNDTDLEIIYWYEDERITKEFCVELFLINDEVIPSFKVMRCYPTEPPDLSENERKALQLYSYFFIGSSVFILLTLGVYAILPELQNIHGVSIMCYLTSLVLNYVFMSTVKLSGVGKDSEFCIFIAVVSHFCVLATFTWLNVVCFDVFSTFRGMQQIKINKNQLGKRFIYYSLYGWGVPLTIVGIGQVMDIIKNLPDNFVKPQFGVWTCWFYSGNRGSLWLYFYGPINILIASNVVLFILTAIHLHRESQATAFAGRKNQAKQKFRIIVSLFLLMGVPWITEMVTFAVDLPFEVTVVTDILNILTGFYVFIIFVCKPSVWNLLKKKFPFLQHLNSIAIFFSCKFFRRNLNAPSNKTPGCDENSASQVSSRTSDEFTLSSDIRSVPDTS